MGSTELISNIEFSKPSKALAATGLLAWVSCTHGVIQLRGIELRRSLQRELTISFAPARIIDGRVCCSAKPTSDPARRAMLQEIVTAATREGWLQ